MSRDPLPIETQRLRLRRLREEDAVALQAYRSDPEVARYQSWVTFSSAEAVALIVEQASVPFAAEDCWCQFAIAHPDDDTLLGDIGLYAGRLGTALIGFTLAISAQGHGYAFEAVSALLVTLRGERPDLEIVAITDARNAPAIALLLRLRFTLERTNQVTFKGEPCEELRFAL